MRGTLMKSIDAKVTRFVQQTPDVSTVYFTLADGSVLDYAAGQYTTVYLKGSTTREGKAYSFSSSPDEPEMSITVKNIGEFSGYLHGLRPGDSMCISPAYGYFNPLTTQPLICIAAGVGISPIWSVLKHELTHDPHRVLSLLYSNKTIDGIVFRHELDAYMERCDNVSVTHYITRQSDIEKSMIRGRITLDEANITQPGAKYLICGSVAFTRAIWEDLIKKGIAKEDISTEVFFEW